MTLISGDSVRGKAPLACFYPAAGIFVALSLSIGVHFLLPGAEMHVLEVAARVFEAAVGVTGWAFAVTQQGRRIHCGGTLQSDAEHPNPTVLFWGILGVLALLACGLLVKGYVFVFFLFIIAWLVLLSGQIGWGSPLTFLRGFPR